MPKMVWAAGISWGSLFSALDRTDVGLQVQIRCGLLAAIEGRRLLPGTRLPSSRNLAELLGVSRTTVVRAYEMLIDDGYLTARERSGIFVGDLLAGPAAHGRPQEQGAGWATRFAVHPSRFRHILKPRNWQDFPYPFLFGQFDAGLFPVAEWRESVKAASSVSGINAWSHDMIDEDDAALTEQLRLRILPRRAIWAAEDEVMITLGAQQALYLVIRLFVGINTPAGIEDPGYPDARHMMRLHTEQLRLLTVDSHGLVPDAIFRGCAVAMVTPGHHCPTTAVMPETRRNELLQSARAHDVVLIEDDYDSGMLSAEDALPPLKSRDSDGRVIYVGSLSKLFAPGLRIGYVVAPAPIIRELRALRRIMLRHPPSNNQRAMAMFIALGHYRTHLRRIQNALRERAALMDRLLPKYLPDSNWRGAAGANSYWVQGPPSLDARAFAERAAGLGVLVEPGDVFFDDPVAGRNCFRLGITAIRTSQIEGGLRRLGSVRGAEKLGAAPVQR